MTEKADPARKLYIKLRLWEFPDQYIVEPTDGSSGSLLAISRLDGAMNHIDVIPKCNSLRVPRIQRIYGVVGMLKLLAGSYLLVITECECIGSYLGHAIFRIMSMKVLACDLSLKRSPEEQEHALNASTKIKKLLFVYSVQRLNDLGDESKLLPLWRQADPRFLWNNYMLELLIDNKLDPYLLPVMQGSFHTFQTAIGKDILDVARRCTKRIGTRMWRRGADSDGFVANFMETEQIIQLNGHTASFVQSFPLTLSLIMIGLSFATLSLRRVRHDWWNLLFSIMWASMSLVIAAFVKSNNSIFCNRPRLHQPRRS